MPRPRQTTAAALLLSTADASRELVGVALALEADVAFQQHQRDERRRRRLVGLLVSAGLTVYAYDVIAMFVVSGGWVG